MAENNQQTYDTVFGYFPSEQSAETTVRALHAAGFSREQIGISGRPDREGYASASDSDSFAVTDRRSTHSKAYEEGHKAGEVASGFWARIRSLFENDAAEPYADEAQRGEYGTQEITDSHDYDSSDFHRTLGGSSVPEERTRYFTSRFGRENQGVLVTVRAGDRRAEADSIIESNGGETSRMPSGWPRKTSGTDVCLSRLSQRP